MQYIKSNRTGIDQIINAVKAHLPMGREVALTITNLQRAQMFLGLVLGTLGAENPYPESTNALSGKIEDRADQAISFLEIPVEVPNTFTAKVKYLRGVIQDYINSLENNVQQYTSRHFVTSIDALCEAKMWLGQELNNIKMKDDEINSQISTKG